MFSDMLALNGFEKYSGHEAQLQVLEVTGIWPNSQKFRAALCSQAIFFRLGFPSGNVVSITSGGAIIYTKSAMNKGLMEGFGL